MPRKKSPESPAPDDLTPEENRSIRKWVKNHPNPEIRALDHPGKGGVRWQIEHCLAHFQSSGEWKASWLATCRKWMMLGVDMESYKSAEKPQYNLDLRDQKGNVTNISEILRDIK